MSLGTLTLIVSALLRAVEGNVGYEMNVYQATPGVYFEHLGHATLSNTAWTIIVYVPMHAIDHETSNLEKYAQYIDRTCSRIVRNWTACSHFGDIMTDVEYNEIKMREGLSQFQTYITTFGSNRKHYLSSVT
jgi:nickel-dependent lactate racemase